ncbi:phosphoenolpyruvate--protein phosphotransferase [Fodinibius sp. AD559]|uniref:phosphoenolpyruvate--protein phosphotransferase n=1 Tax=Fodinibius sp. AD559 TaxID=3424179 RepID=UPI0040469484
MSDQVDHKERYISGAPACPGIVIGNASLYQRVRPHISDTQIADDEVEDHIHKFYEALDIAEDELEILLKNTDMEDLSDLIQMQIAILKDPELHDRVEQEISANNKPVDSAVESIFRNYLQVIRENHGETFQNKSVDISDIRDRLLQIIHNKGDEIKEGTILVAQEMSPREIISFSSRDIKGLITDRGGATSHAAIIARSMNIPTVVGAKRATEIINSDDEVVLDGRNGEVIVYPKNETRQKYESLIEQQSKRQADFESLCKKPNKTSDGKPFTLQANIEFAEELSIANKYQAQGVGLLRTESIYLSRKHFQNIDHQVAFYTSILELTAPHQVTIRLFDVGGDKFFGDEEKEQNPFLGWRGIRMLLEQPELLKNQLRAIFKTSGSFMGRIRILVPMVSAMDEIRKLKNIIGEIQEELISEGINIDKNIPLGLMVEVPSVALKANLFARHADFLSIGTNDLTQYVLAVDRGNERISNLYDQRHPAIWWLIKEVAEAGERNKIPVSVCGELASDPIAASCLMGLGIDTLSMNAVVLPSVKQMLRSYSHAEMQQLAKKVLQAETLDDIDNLFSNWETKG